MEIEFVASMSVIAAEPTESRKLFVEALGLPLKAAEGDDYFSERTVPQEPWGRTVARLQSVDSLIIGISCAPGCIADGCRTRSTASRKSARLARRRGERLQCWGT